LSEYYEFGSGDRPDFCLYDERNESFILLFLLLGYLYFITSEKSKQETSMVMTVAVGYRIEHAVILAVSSVFLLAGFVQLVLWRTPQFKGKVKINQFVHILPVLLHNVTVFIIGIDPRCIYNILNPSMIIVLLTIAAYILVCSAVIFWRLLYRVQDFHVPKVETEF
jgi:hypothetical protein